MRNFNSLDAACRDIDDLLEDPVGRVGRYLGISVYEDAAIGAADPGVPLRAAVTITDHCGPATGFAGTQRHLDTGSVRRRDRLDAEAAVKLGVRGLLLDDTRLAEAYQQRIDLRSLGRIIPELRDDPAGFGAVEADQPLAARPVDQYLIDLVQVPGKALQEQRPG